MQSLSPSTKVGNFEEDLFFALLIEPSRGWVSLQASELWRFRELLYFLTWRDIKVRYKQTVIDASWAIIQPFLTIVEGGASIRADQALVSPYPTDDPWRN